ncbi:MAG: chalcone isomerase family protein [bacterium]
MLRLMAVFMLSMLSSVVFAQADLSFKVKGEVFYKGLIKVYDASLYVDDIATANNLLEANTSRCLKLDYAVSLDKEKFIRAANVVLNRQQPAETLKTVQAQIDQLHAAYQPVKKGDTYWMCYYANNQKTELRLNDQVLVELPRSANFSRIYMGMWLAEDKPISKKLRETLLSRL